MTKKEISKEELETRIKDHKLWTENNGGRQLVLIGYNLRGADLQGYNLIGSDLRGSYLQDHLKYRIRGGIGNI